MNTVFVINPKAGQGKSIEKLVDSIKSITDENNYSAEIYITNAVGDGEKFVSKYCETKGPARFIACGGDGTLDEVLNGAINCPDAEIGVIPIGTGNDFCRNFDEEYDFRSIKAQLMGETTKCDAIKYTNHLDKSTRYCANMFNIGFDCNVADMTARMKKKPLISGSMAYLLSIFAMLIKKKGENLKIELDGEAKHQGPLLLTSIANGTFCGGGIKSNPGASLQDGRIDVNIINNISRIGFIKLLPHYMKGTHTSLEGIDHIITTLKCKRLTITPLDGRMRLCADGEIADAAKTDFEIVSSAFNFVLPTEKTRCLN